MTQFPRALTVWKEVEMSDFRARRVWIGNLTKFLHRTRFASDLAAGCRRHNICPLAISFNRGKSNTPDGEVEVTFAHVLFATIDDAQGAHEHFHMSPLLVNHRAPFWNGGPPVLPAGDMYKRRPDGTYVAGRWNAWVHR